MSTNKDKQAREVFKAFRKRKMLTMSTLSETLMCSERTIQRHLKNWNVCTSYNQNGRYYTLPDIPKFNRDGIWKYNSIFFSKYGNLKKTVIAVIKQSDSGLSAQELTEMTGLSAYTFLSHFKNTSDIKREKQKGVYVYFSSDSDGFIIQKQRRESTIQTKTLLDLPADSAAISILVELVKNPTANIDKLARLIRRKGISVSTLEINNLLAYHGIVKKKP
jgi:transcriptional antiterminator